MRLIDPAAERAVISGVFNYGHDAYVDVSDLLVRESFGIESNQALYRCLEHLVKDNPKVKPDLPTLRSAANSLGLGHVFEDADERKHVRAVTQLAVDRGNVRPLAEKVMKLYVARQLQGELMAAHDQVGDVTGDEAVEAILALAEARVNDFVCRLAGTDEGGSELGEGLDEYLDYVESNPVTQVGISSGMRSWDLSIGGGLRAGAVPVVAARMKVGKSQFGMNVGKNVAVVQDIPVWYGDTELTKKDHWNRICGNLANVPVEDIETGQYAADPAKRARVRAAAADLKKAPYRYECIAGKPFHETLALMRRWVLQKVGLGEDGKAKPCVLVFDYLKLMDSGELGKDIKEYQVLGFMMTSLHNFAIRYGVPILVLLQLNRDGIDKEDMSAIGGSDRIGMLCTSATLLKWQSAEERAEQGMSKVLYSHKLVHLVGRHGKGLPAEDFIHMHAEYEYGRLTEGPLRSELVAEEQKSQGFEVEVDDAEPESIAFGPPGDDPSFA